MERHSECGVKNGGYDGAAADIWSVGIVLFVLLSGTQPTNSKLEHKWSACSFDDNDIWNTISMDAKQIIQKLTSVTAIERPSAASTLLMPWFSVPESQSPGAGCTNLVPDSKRRKRNGSIC